MRLAISIFSPDDRCWHLFSGTKMKTPEPKLCFIVIALTILMVTLTEPCIPQTVRVNATPGQAVNTFSPLHALGTTVDRVPSNATDTFFRPDQLRQILSAGWGAISYRQ